MTSYVRTLERSEDSISSEQNFGLSSTRELLNEDEQLVVIIVVTVVIVSFCWLIFFFFICVYCGTSTRKNRESLSRIRTSALNLPLQLAVANHNILTQQSNPRDTDSQPQQQTINIIINGVKKKDRKGMKKKPRKSVESANFFASGTDSEPEPPIRVPKKRKKKERISFFRRNRRNNIRKQNSSANDTFADKRTPVPDNHGFDYDEEARRLNNMARKQDEIEDYVDERFRTSSKPRNPPRLQDMQPSFTKLDDRQSLENIFGEHTSAVQREADAFGRT